MSKNNTLRVLFVPVGGETFTAARDRIYIYFDTWKEYGIEATAIPWRFMISKQEKTALYQKIVKEAKNHDIVYLFRAMVPAKWMRRLRENAKCLVWDFDDAIYHVPSTQCSEAFPQSRSIPEKIKQVYRLCARQNRYYSARQPILNQILKNCDGVVAGNKVLAKYSSQFVERHVIAPSPIDVTNISAKQHNGTKTVVVGWTGTPSNINYLETYKEAFRKLGDKYGGRVKLKVVSQPRAIDIDGINLEFRQWTPEIDKSVLMTFDIGIMPLTNDGWSAGKCGFKALLCMGANLPTVVSPVGINTEIIKDGQNGFHAATDEEWAEKLGHLIEDAHLRKVLGENGRQTVLTEYSREAIQPRIAAFLHKLV